jgi:hypothetical protein
MSDLRFADLPTHEALRVAALCGVFPWASRAILNDRWEEVYPGWRFERDRVGELSLRPPPVKRCEACGR